MLATLLVLAGQVGAEPAIFSPTPGVFAVRIPRWIEETTGVGYTLSAMSSKDRQAASQAGVTISELGLVDPFYAYYDSKLLAKRSPHVPLERVNQDLTDYKRHSIRVLGVYPPTLQSEVYQRHPDWRRVAEPNGKIPEVDLKQHPYGGMLCILGPYSGFFIDVLVEIVTKFPDVDAFSFDGLHYAGVCYCQHCRAGFRQATGQEIPPVDLHNPVFRRYQNWADRRLEDVVRRMQTKIKAVKPTVGLVTWTTNAGRFGHFLSIPRNMPARLNLLFDAPDQELWLDETNRGASIVPAFGCAYIWATTNHRVAFCEPYLMSHGNPYGKDSFPKHEVLRRMLLPIAHGAGTSIAVAQPGPLQSAVREGLAEIQKRKPWMTDKHPEPWLGLVMSDDTRNYYGREAGKVEDRYLSHVFGFFRAMQETHLPTTLLNDWNLTDNDLARYAVIVLPNTACLSNLQIQALDRYVRNGGGLVATNETSLFNELGDPREQFGLAETLGVQYAGLATSDSSRESLDVNFAKGVSADYWAKRRSVFPFKLADSSILASAAWGELVGAETVTFKGPALRIRPANKVKVEGTFEGQPPGSTPVVVSRTYGAGRVVYFAAGVDSAYYLYPFPYQRLLLEQAVRWAARRPPSVQITAPKCVQSSIFRQTRAGERLLVHLYNNINTTAFHGLPNDDVPLREETLPIYGIRVQFDKRYTITQVRVEPGGQVLAVENQTDGAVVTIPKLDVHAIVVAELNP